MKWFSVMASRLGSGCLPLHPGAPDFNGYSQLRGTLPCVLKELDRVAFTVLAGSLVSANRP